MFSNVFYRTCKRVLEEPGLLERLREEKFDVMIVENFDVCGVGELNIFSRSHSEFAFWYLASLNDHWSISDHPPWKKIVIDNHHYSGISNAVSPKSVIGVSSSALSGWHFSEWGVPEAASYRPSTFQGSQLYKKNANNKKSKFYQISSVSSTANLDVHSFSSRLYNLYGSFLNRLLFGFSRRSVNRALREHFGPEYPTLEVSDF